MDELRPETAANGERNSLDVGDPKAGILQTLISIAQSIRALLGLRLAELSLANGHDEILLRLDAEPESAAILAARLEMRETVLTKLLEPLIARGLIERVGDVHDARRGLMRLTAAGAVMQERIRDIWNEIGNDLVGAKGSEQLDRLIVELESMQKQMSGHMNRFC